MKRLLITYSNLDSLEDEVCIRRPSYVSVREGKTYVYDLNISSSMLKGGGDEAFLDMFPDCEDELRELIHFEESELYPDITCLLPQSSMTAFFLSENFALHVWPTLDIDSDLAFADFVSNYGKIDIDSYEPLSARVGGINEPESFLQEIETIPLNLNNQSIGHCKVFDNRTGRAILRDLRGIVSHFIAENNDEDEFEAWSNQGYSLVTEIGNTHSIKLIAATMMLENRLNFWFRHVHYEVKVRRVDLAQLPNEKNDTGPVTTLYSASPISIGLNQLKKSHEGQTPIRQCAHVHCKRYFDKATGYGQTKTHRDSSRYCSKNCVRAAASMRNRQKVKVQQGKASK